MIAPRIETETVDLSDGSAIVVIHGTVRADGKVVSRFIHSGTLLSTGQPLTEVQRDEAGRLLGVL